MRDRTDSVARVGPTRPTAASLDLVICTPRDRHLAVLVRTGPRGGSPVLPWVALDGESRLGALAGQFAKQTIGVAPSWFAQVGGFGDGLRHPSTLPLSIGYVAVVPTGTDAPQGTEWRALAECSALSPRQSRVAEVALQVLRDRMDIEPVAFRMLPKVFTLSELQEVYELLLGRRLHKASFRRALQAAYLVDPTDEWRSEGRGRPAQLFRYSPRKRRSIRRSVRFELLG